MGVGGEKRIPYKSYFNQHYSNYTIRYMYYSSQKSEISFLGVLHRIILVPIFFYCKG